MKWASSVMLLGACTTLPHRTIASLDSPFKCFQLIQKLFEGDADTCFACRIYDPQMHINDLGFLERPFGEHLIVQEPGAPAVWWKKQGIDLIQEGHLMPATLHDSGHLQALAETYAAYENGMENSFVELDRRIEESLPLNRQAYGLVYDQKTRATEGMLRIFDGTKGYGPSDPKLPVEREFEARGIPISSINALRAGQPLYELGKFLIPKNIPPGQRLKARVALETWVLSWWVRANADAVFVVHAVTRAHAVLYERAYGLKIVEEVAVPGSVEKEYILAATGNEIVAKLQNRVSEGQAQVAALHEIPSHQTR